MRKLLWASFLISISLIVVIVVDKASLNRPLGPLATLAIAALVIWAAFSIISLVVYRRNNREIIKNVWMASAATILSYLIFDLCAGFMFIDDASPYMIPDKLVHHKLLPKSSYVFKNSEFEFVQRVNNIGVRGRDISRKNEENTYRILMLGDSFTMGKGVREEDTFSVILEKSLVVEEAESPVRKIEVINAGVDSYTPLLSFLLLEHYLNGLEQDLLVLSLDMSDLIQEVAYRKLARYDENGKIMGVIGEKKSGITEPISRWIDRNLYITRLVFFYVKKRSKDTETIAVEDTVRRASFELLKHTLADDGQDRTDQWQNIFESILRIKEYCDTHDSEFLLATYPWGHQVSDKEWSTQRSLFIPPNAEISDRSVHKIRDFADENRVDFINAFAAFRQYRGPEPLYFDNDMHWTPAGHRIMAKELERFIRDNYIDKGQ